MAKTRNLTPAYRLQGARAQSVDHVPTDTGVKQVTSIVQGDIEIFIDVDELLRTLGSRALLSGAKKAVLGGGVIVARATNIVKTPSK